MKERNSVILFFVIFLFLGTLTFYLLTFYSDFNFYKSKLEIDNLFIKEKLFYHTDKPYHTLYRNFQDPLYPSSIISAIISKNYILLKDLSCSEGQPYLKDYNYNCYNLPEFSNTNCQPFTEKNEYGCTFGNTLGFKNNVEYTINSNFILNPSNLFKIKDNHYIKFIAYSRDNHKLLTKNNFLTSKNVIRKKN